MVQEFDCQHISYKDTNRFTRIVQDYIGGDKKLRPFYQFEPSFEGIKQAIEAKKSKPFNRQLLYNELKKQYKDLNDSNSVIKNIELLKEENTFSICTAHQPNLFTGHFYFIHKIIHIIRLANDLNEQLPEYKFVPIFFVGSEDADIDELNNIQFEGKKYVWETKQTGAVGKMFVDEKLLKIISDIKGRLLVEHFGKEISNLLDLCFTKGATIQQATFLFVHHLFKKFGLIVFLPDSPAFKKEFINILSDDIFNNTPAGIVKKTSDKIAVDYHAQAYPRDINIFYMKDDIRERIVKFENKFIVHNTELSFTEEELKTELNEHPERFSPNVILRGLFQETFLPDVAWIGGGGELAYWLQLKDLFEHYGTPYPVLMLRNSLLIIEDKFERLRGKLGLTIKDLFNNEEDLLKRLIQEGTEVSLSLENEKQSVEALYNSISDRTSKIDATLVDHVAALKVKQIKRLKQLEKKFISAEKKKQEATGRQLGRLMTNLFPDGGLQERTDNFMLLYAKWGEILFDEIYKYSPTFESSFTIITEKRIN